MLASSHRITSLHQGRPTRSGHLTTPDPLKSVHRATYHMWMPVRLLRQIFSMLLIIVYVCASVVTVAPVANAAPQGISGRGWHRRISFLGCRGRRLIPMDCIGCGSAAVTERPDLTAQAITVPVSDCGRQFNERHDGVLDRASLPSDVVAFVRSAGCATFGSRARGRHHHGVHGLHSK